MLEGKVNKTGMGNETEVETIALACKGNVKTFTVVEIYTRLHTHGQLLLILALACALAAFE